MGSNREKKYQRMVDSEKVRAKRKFRKEKETKEHDSQYRGNLDPSEAFHLTHTTKSWDE